MFKQQTGRIWLGAIISQASRAQFYVAFLMSFLTSAAAYEQVRAWLPWINFWILFGVVVTFYLVAGIWDYIVATPGIVAYQNEQVCKHYNPVIDHLLKIEKHLGIKEESEPKKVVTRSVLTEAERLVLEALDNNGLPHDFIGRAS